MDQSKANAEREQRIAELRPDLRIGLDQIERGEVVDEKDVFDRLRERCLGLKKMTKKTKIALIVFLIAILFGVIFATLSPAIFYHQSFLN